MATSYPTRGVARDPSSGYEFARDERDDLAAIRKRGISCGRCGGFVELARDISQRATATCLNCGRPVEVT